MTDRTIDVGNLRYPFVELHAETGDRKRVPITVVNTAEEAFAQNTPNKLAVAVVDFSYTTVTGGAGSTISMRVIDPSFDGLETHFLQAAGMPVVWFRYGWRFSDGTEMASELAPMRVTNWEGEFIGNATFTAAALTITAMDDSALLGSQATQIGLKSTDSITAGISDIVNAAKGATAGKKLVVEVRAPTTTTMTDALNKAHGRTPIRYIRDLLAYASTDELFLTYYMEYKDGAWHLVIDAVKPTAKPQRVYVFSRDRQGEMLNFRPKYSGLLIRGIGGGQVDSVATDSSTLTATPKSSSASTDDDPAHGNYFPRDDEIGAPSRIVALASREQQLIDAYIRSRRRRADLATYPATADIVGDPFIRPIRNVLVIVSKGAHALQAAQDLFREGDYHHSTGLYTVMQITHSITPGVYRTQLNLQRGSTNVGGIKAKVTSGDGPKGWVRERTAKTESEVERGVKSVGAD